MGASASAARGLFAPGCLRPLKTLCASRDLYTRIVCGQALASARESRVDTSSISYVAGCVRAGNAHRHELYVVCGWLREGRQCASLRSLAWRLIRNTKRDLIRNTLIRNTKRELI